MALDCLKHAFFAHFMSEQIQLFDLELKISFGYDIETRANYNFRFRFDLETKRCVFFKLRCAQKKNQTTTFNILY
jgi:tricorn protease-like protein